MVDNKERMYQIVKDTMEQEKKLQNGMNLAHKNLIDKNTENVLEHFYDQMDTNLTRAKEFLYRYDEYDNKSPLLADMVARHEMDELVILRNDLKTANEIIMDANKAFGKDGYGAYADVGDKIKVIESRDNMHICELLSQESKQFAQMAAHIKSGDSKIEKEWEERLRSDFRELYQRNFKSRHARAEGFKSGKVNDFFIKDAIERTGIATEDPSMARVILLAKEKNIPEDIIRGAIEKFPEDPAFAAEYIRTVEKCGEKNAELIYKDYECGKASIEDFYIKASIIEKEPELEKVIVGQEHSLDELEMIDKAVDANISPEVIMDCMEQNETGEFHLTKEGMEELQELIDESKDTMSFEDIGMEEKGREREEFSFEEMEESEKEEPELYESVFEEGLRGGTAAAAVSLFGEQEVQPVKATVLHTGEKRSFADMLSHVNNLHNKEKLDRISDMADDIPNSTDFMIKDEHGCDYIHVQKDVNGNISISSADGTEEYDKDTLREKFIDNPGHYYHQMVVHTRRYQDTKERNERSTQERTRTKDA